MGTFRLFFYMVMVCAYIYFNGVLKLGFLSNFVTVSRIEILWNKNLPVFSNDKFDIDFFSNNIIASENITPQRSLLELKICSC